MTVVLFSVVERSVFISSCQRRFYPDMWLTFGTGISIAEYIISILQLYMCISVRLSA